MIIYYNPKCSTCRQTKDLLEENNCEFEIRDYLAEPPSQKELKELIQKLGCKPFDIVRQKEPIFINEYKGKKITDAKWIKILSENPILIERPIVIEGKKAVIGRPPLLVLSLLKKRKKS
ncbi:MAG: arsenate reductase [Bacteroidetes bacterium]|nr:arsenate reductase [Bacteroidota bacterium]